MLDIRWYIKKVMRILIILVILFMFGICINIESYNESFTYKCDAVVFYICDKVQSMYTKTSKLSFEIDNDEIQNKDVNIVAGNTNCVHLNLKLKNTGENDIFIRMMIEPIVLSNSGEIIPVSLNNDCFEIVFTDPNNTDEQYWSLGEDGYYYYKVAVKSKESVKEQLVSDILLKPNTKETSSLMGKKLKIIIYVESIQSNNQYYKDFWKITK